MSKHCSDKEIEEFYETYPRVTIGRLEHPTWAVFKSYLAWRQFGPQLLSLAGDINTVADVGGCFGFGLNAFLSYGSKALGHQLQGDIYELGDLYLRVGPELFPRIRFTSQDYASVVLDQPYDITLMFDLLEHLADPDAFLAAASERTRFLVIKTPLEASTHWECLRRAGQEPPLCAGASHPDGHRHFFTLSTFCQLVERHFALCSVWIMPPYSWPDHLLFEVSRLELRTNLYTRTRRFVGRIRRAMWRTLGVSIHRALVTRGMRPGNAFLLARGRCP